MTFTPAELYVLEAPSGGKVVKHLDVQFTVDDDGDGTPDENVDVGIAFGVHLAGEVNWGVDNGAGTFPGASPQVKVNLDSATNDENININPNAVLARPRILIVKNDTADSDTLFDFTGELGAFQLQDPSDNTETFLGLASGEFTVTEVIEGGFALTGITCAGIEIQSGSSFTPTFTVNGNSVDITVDFDQQVTCTFTNTAAPTMTVEKSSVTTSLSAPTTVNYDYVVTNTGFVTLTGISLSDDNDNNDMVCGTDTLAPAASTTCTATHTFTQAELNANGSPTPASGVLFNEVTATSDQGAGRRTT